MSYDSMNTKPIIFQDSMVRALLEGRKAQTRRVVKPRPSGPEVRMLPDGWGFESYTPRQPEQFGPLSGERPEQMHDIQHCPYGQPGDLLWVRETWADVSAMQNLKSVIYRADYPVRPSYKFRPSIHMPRRVSRLTLRLTDVRVERVQEISDEDAISEGCFDIPEEGKQQAARRAAVEGKRASGPREHFKELWDSINAAKGYGWDTNPWVWCLSFEVIQANVDQVPGREVATNDG